MRVTTVGVAVVVVAAGAFLSAGERERRTARGASPVLHAAPGELSRVFARAPEGSTILLEGGDHGQFRGGVKRRPITIRPRGRARASIVLDFNGVAGVHLEGLDIDGLTITGRSRDIAVRDSRFRGAAVIRAEQLDHAGIVLASNRFPGIDVCPGCFEGRISVVGQSPQASGVTLQRNVLGPGGDADGMLIGANRVRVIGNTFRGIVQRPDPQAPHTDALQLYGQRRTLIRGNHFTENSTAIMAPDGGEQEVITDNVFLGSGYRPAVQLGGHTQTIFEHNTVQDIDVYMDSKQGTPGSRGGMLRENVMIGSSFRLRSGGGCSGCTVERNLFSRAGDASGARPLVARPKLAGGRRPARWAGFRLAPRSPGRGAGDGGADLGIRGSGRR